MDSILPIAGKQVGKATGLLGLRAGGARPLKHGLTMLPLVGDTGFEPVTSSVLAKGLLRGTALLSTACVRGRT
jgi:hypothetical protein